MKKFLFVLLAVVAMCTSVQAQLYTINPPAFTAEDEITITVNLAGTGKLDTYEGDLYLWAWVAEGCTAANCDAPTNISPATPGIALAKLTRDQANPDIARITLVPSAFYGRSPSEIKKMGFLVKGADWGDGQTTDGVFSVDPLVFTPRVNRIFPTKVTKDDVVTLYLDQAAATNLDLKYQTGSFTISVTAYNSSGDAVGTAITDRATVNAGNGLHYLRVLPTYTFGTTDIASLKYKFTNLTDEDIESDEFELVFFN